MRDVAIYYFSATGNSLAAAQALSECLNAAEPISIPGSLASSDPYAAARHAQAVGFVFPVQRATIPKMLKHFIESLPVKPQRYYFAVATYSLFGGNEFWDIDELLNAKGALLNYAASIRMMGNVGLTKPSGATIHRRLEQMQAHIERIATSVRYRQENYFPRASLLLGKAVRLFTESRRKNLVLHVGRQCRQCGVCVQVCPAQNIRIPTQGSKCLAPTRLNRCEACLACVHWCPFGAIGTPTRLHTRYHNPTISPEQLQRNPQQEGAAQKGALDINHSATAI